MTATAPLPDVSALQHEARAAAFVAEIRRHCSDLPADEIDELTDGLGADLADRLAEGAELGDAAEYAAELRAAAGLPPKNDVKKRASLGDGWAATKRWWMETPRRRAIAEFLAVLTPVWWVARGLIVALLLRVMLSGVELLSLLLGAAAIVISVQWGIGRLQPNAFVVFLRRATSVGAVIALVPISFMLLGSWFAGAGQAETNEPWVQQGLAVDGEPVENVFAYDCVGNPIDGVQLFDASGQPLNVAEDSYVWDESTQEDVRMAPNALASRPDAWNVFPLAREGSASELTTLPFAHSSALSEACPTNAADKADKADEAGGPSAEAKPETKVAAE